MGKSNIFTQKPPIKDFDMVEMSPVHSEILDNGVKLNIIDRGNQPVCRLDIVFSGGIYEQAHPIVAQTVVSSVRYGAEGFTSEEIAEKLDFCGAWFSGTAHDHHTSFTLYSTNSCFAEILPMIESMIKNPTFPEKECSVHIGRMESRLKTKMQKVDYLATMAFYNKFFGDSHPLGRMTSIDDIKSLNVEMLRDFVREYYNSMNCEIFISGLPDENIINEIKNRFGIRWGNQTLAHKHNCPVIEFKNLKSIIDKPDAIQCGVVMAMQGVPRNANDYIPLRLLIILLGGFFGSRLMKNIREEKGYTYGIGAGLSGRTDCSYITISSQCDTKYVDALIDEVKKEIIKLQTERVTDEEIEILRSYMMSDMVKTVDTPFTIADYCITSLCNAIPDDYFANQVEWIKKISPEILMEMAQKYLDINNMIISVAGDKKIIECGDVSAMEI